MSSSRLILLSIFLAFGSKALAQVCSTAPSEARTLEASGSSAVRLSWLVPTDTGGSSTILYDVLRSASPSSFSGAQCLASGIPVLSYDDIGFTGTGYYLIRSRNACGSNLGATSTGTPRTGPSCPQSDGGQCFNGFDCLTTACCDGFCRDLDTNVVNCGTCGFACAAANGVPNCINGVCGLASCNPGFENCDSYPGNGCEASLDTDPLNCGTCGVACASAPNAAATCSASNCSISCNPGFADCDGSPENGCECAGNLCCFGGCAPPHVNGLGQSFDDCAPSGVPGDPATYSLQLAQAARAAWPVAGSDSTGTCGVGGNAAAAVIRQTATSCAVWVYTKTTAGYVHLNNAGSACICPTISDPTWM